ncbi:hypothetical protein K431DRAFT_206105, partial [Polychaeton citri CBS 116435]
IPSFKKRTNKSTNIRKRPATPPPAASSDDSASEYSSTDDEAQPGARVKRRKTRGVDLGAGSFSRQHDLSKSTAFAADRSANIAKNEDATRESNWNRVAAEEAARMNAKNTRAPPSGDGKGTAAGADANGGKTVGPVKAPANVRQITVTDFAPDVCKDYKQTGFCGFGDGCKFLHAREDYAAGWKLDKEWEKVQQKKKNGTAGDDGGAGDDADEEEKMLAKIPFKCIICKDDYKFPIMTKCGHYFCERCAMTRYTKEKKWTCANCGADTGGSFGIAKKLKELLEKKRRRAEERKAEARE